MNSLETQKAHLELVMITLRTEKLKQPVKGYSHVQKKVRIHKFDSINI